MLVIGTFAEEDEQSIAKEKLEFAEVHWWTSAVILSRSAKVEKHW
jgi:hypothetical protein